MENLDLVLEIVFHSNGKNNGAAAAAAAGRFLQIELTIFTKIRVGRHRRNYLRFDGHSNRV